MKKLLLIWIFSGSLDGFSQVTDTLDLKMFMGVDTLPAGVLISRSTGWLVTKLPAADTIRATLIVYHDGEASIVHTKPGFVVQQFGKEELYLDDKKCLIKSPLEVLTYKLKRRVQ